MTSEKANKVFSENAKKSKFYSKILEILPDAELIELKISEKEDD